MFATSSLTLYDPKFTSLVDHLNEDLGQDFNDPESTGANARAKVAAIGEGGTVFIGDTSDLTSTAGPNGKLVMNLASYPDGDMCGLLGLVTGQRCIGLGPDRSGVALADLHNAPGFDDGPSYVDFQNSGPHSTPTGEIANNVKVYGIGNANANGAGNTDIHIEGVAVDMNGGEQTDDSIGTPALPENGMVCHGIYLRDVVRGSVVGNRVIDTLSQAGSGNGESYAIGLDDSTWMRVDGNHIYWTTNSAALGSSGIGFEQCYMVRVQRNTLTGHTGGKGHFANGIVGHDSQLFWIMENEVTSLGRTAGKSGFVKPAGIMVEASNQGLIAYNIVGGSQDLTGRGYNGDGLSGSPFIIDGMSEANLPAASVAGCLDLTFAHNISENIGNNVSSGYNYGHYHFVSDGGLIDRVNIVGPVMNLGDSAGSWGNAANQQKHIQFQSDPASWANVGDHIVLRDWMTDYSGGDLLIEGGWDDTITALRTANPGGSLHRYATDTTPSTSLVYNTP